jgi:hypothetical protein
MSTARERFALDLWERAQYRFVHHERALGRGWTEAYTNAWRQADEVVAIFYASDRPLITLGLRTIST